MSYDGKVMRRALTHFEEDKRGREEAFRRRQDVVYRREPRLREIQEEINATLAKLITSALRRGTDPRPAVAVLRDRNLSLQQEREHLLAGLGLPADYLEEKPACPLCGDTGYRGEAVCRCLRGYYAKEQKKELSRLLNLGDQSFDTFSLDWYSGRTDPEYGLSPRKNMEAVYDICAEYASHFTPKSGNLLLFGAPGLGKTFLSACIAREVSDAGYSVVYDTAGHVFACFEDRKFGRGEESTLSGVERILNCDLLILDDLGTEMTTSFVVSALYEILNSRLITGRATILNSNLAPEDLERRYSEQIASRIQGEYRLLPLFGEDIRKLKRERED